MPSYHDEEFGEIDVRKLRRTRYVRISVTPAGKLRATMPFFSTTRSLKTLLTDSRQEIRKMLDAQVNAVIYEDGMRVGKSHSIVCAVAPELKIRTSKLRIEVSLPETLNIRDAKVQEVLRDEVRKNLRKEAKHYLPRRLATLANQLDCHYERVRFSHASTRWGSCSSSGTISLNIALMQLPFELIDYVLIHELSHTKQMNHSQDFWGLVALGDPEYKAHRKILKNHTPTI